MAGASPRRRAVLGVLGAALLVLSGCGGDDSESSGSDVVSQPEPNEPISTQVDAFNEAIATQDCEKLAPLGISLTRPHLAAGTPPSKSECRDTMPVLKSLKGIEMQDSAEFG